MAQSLPGALPILDLHDKHRFNPLRRQISSQLPEVVAEQWDGDARARFPLQRVELGQQHAARLFRQARSHEPRIRDLAASVLLRQDQAAETVRARGEISNHDEFFCGRMGILIQSGLR